MTDIKASVLFVSGKPAIVTLDYIITMDEGKDENEQQKQINEFRLSYYPHKLSVFTEILDEAFHYRAKHTIYGDFKNLEEIKNAGFYIHVMEKPI